jgi:lipopolysaccharide transport system ATP-binding protein
MNEVAIRVEGLGKRYRIGQREPYSTLRESLAGAFAFPFRWLRNGQHLTLNGGSSVSNPQSEIRNPKSDFIWALKDVSFQVQRGEVVGIIGRNGAGKSTLLKILSRITEPSKGYAEINGRVGSLLEVGTGFHPELTGRENIYLNGAILGMKNVEITRRFDEIVAFAELDNFIDTPVKRYSNGMYVRLAFAVAAHLNFEVLLIDEVLAVGDIVFQRKCLRKIQDVSIDGRTIVFVTHNVDVVQQLCPRALWIGAGRILLDDQSQLVATAYLRDALRNQESKHHYSIVHSSDADGDQDVRLLEADILNSAAAPCEFLRFGEGFRIRMLWEHSATLAGLSYAVRISDDYDRFLFAANTINDPHLPIDQPGIHEVFCSFGTNILVPGFYNVTIGSYLRPHRTIHVANRCLRLVVAKIAYDSRHPFDVVGDPLVALAAEWSVASGGGGGTFAKPSAEP